MRALSGVGREDVGLVRGELAQAFAHGGGHSERFRELDVDALVARLGRVQTRVEVAQLASVTASREQREPLAAARLDHARSTGAQVDEALRIRAASRRAARPAYGAGFCAANTAPRARSSASTCSKCTSSSRASFDKRIEQHRTWRG
jgi:hypothetical protein